MDRARKLLAWKSRVREEFLPASFLCARDPRVSLLACRMDIGQDFSGSEALTQVVFQKKKSELGSFYSCIFSANSWMKTLKKM